MVYLMRFNRTGMIIGHQKIISYFDNAIKNKKLSQSYCFVGYDQVGKRTVARDLSAKILKIDEKKLDLYPDFYYVCRQEDEKTGKLKKDITISQARQIKDRVGRKSWLGEYQVVVLDEAELLNEEAANALLKILEETKGKCIFFLLTTDDNALLPTIKSRCQMFYFALAGEDEIKTDLEKMGYEGQTASDAAKLSWGRPGRAKDLASDEILLHKYRQEIERWAEMIKSPFFKKMEILNDLLGDKTDAMRAKEKLHDVLEIWIMIWRDAMLAKLSGGPEIIGGNRLSAGEISSLIDDLRGAGIMLDQNINPKLVIEQIILKYA